MHGAAERRQQVALAHAHQRGGDLVGIGHGGAAGEGVTCQSVAALIGVPAGSAVRMVPSQSSGGTLNILGTPLGGEQSTHLTMAWIGPLA